MKNYKRQFIMLIWLLVYYQHSDQKKTGDWSSLWARIWECMV